ncbi:MAG: HAMP domain-containing histidine kinase [Bacteroidales bacterium]|nr:HAMP domain-containing histidine kinase [Lachnoclostridium sp.]MCM1384306.1 HAMP domain-containing histidine kinase [Lachnoclostridium sp.]MCM1464887.1 HAMP domain-containing histidine kinase [Bacteroidales bacterium]
MGRKKNKTAFIIFLYFTLSAAGIAVLLLLINFLGFGRLMTDYRGYHGDSPSHILETVSRSIIKTEDGFSLSDKDIIRPDYWCILIDETGEIAWSEHMPDDIPSHYSLNDIARMTKWYLNDYPVYVYTCDYGLLVLGLPKYSIGKYDLAYSAEWLSSLPLKMLAILMLNLVLAAVFAFAFGARLYRRLQALMEGIYDLSKEKTVHLKEKGIFRDLARSINHTSASMERKNLALADRDNARSNWISGISHDIRIPLSLIMGHSEALLECGSLKEENQKRAESIHAQSIKIKKLIEDLNLISSLEYDMQPLKKKDVPLCPLIRRIVTDILNCGLSDSYAIRLDMQDKKAVISADENLLERAIFNLLNNSITHNKNGCEINIREYVKDGTIHLEISDNGEGIPEEILEHITEIPKSAHGMGLPMAYRIICAHGGGFQAVNNNGFSVKIQF